MCLMMADNFGIPSLNIVVKDANQDDNDDTNFMQVDNDHVDYVQLDRLQIRQDGEWKSLVRPYFIVNAPNTKSLSSNIPLSLIGAYINRYVSEILRLSKRQFLSTG